MDTRWRVELLGGLRISQGERTVTRFKTRKAEALLACLLLRPDMPCRRDELAQMLWSKDEELGSVLHRLNDALSDLRTQLENPDMFPRGRSSTLFPNPDTFVTDIGEFKGFLAEAAQADAPDERVRLLHAATALYRGDLMPGYNEDWIKEERKVLARKHQEAVRALTQALIEAGDLEGALEQAACWVRVAMHDERAHRIFMEVYEALDRTPEAVLHYEAFERMLQTEKRTPDPKTRAMADRLRESLSRSAPAITPSVSSASLCPDNRVSRTLDPMPPAQPAYHHTRWSSLRNRFAAVTMLCLVVLAVMTVWKVGARDKEQRLSRREQAALLCRHGRAQWNERTQDGLEAALRSFRDAARAAPDYGPAYAGLADTYGLLGYYGWSNPIDAFNLDVQNARRAVRWAADPHEQAEAYTSLGWADMMEWRWTRAEEDFKKAINADTKYPTAHQWYSLCLIIRGDRDNSEAEIGEAKGNDPSSSVIPKSLGQRLYYSGKYDKAVQRCSQALLSHPDDALTTLWLGLAYEQLHEWEKASFSLNEALKPGGRRDVTTLAALRHLRAASGNIQGAEAILKELGTRRNADRPDDYVSPVSLALVHVGLFDAKRSPRDEVAALHQLETAFREHAGDLILIGIEPRFFSLSTDPHFRKIKRRIHL